MITNKTTVRGLTDLVRQADEYVFILTNILTLSDKERETIFRHLREDVQSAHSLLGRLEKSGVVVADETVASTLDAALRVLNEHGVFGSIATVEINKN